MQTSTAIYDTVGTGALEEDISSMEESSWAVRLIEGKFFLIGHGRDAHLAFSGVVVYER